MKSNNTNFKINFKNKNKIKLNISKYEKILLVFITLFIIYNNYKTKIDVSKIIDKIINMIIILAKLSKIDLKTGMDLLIFRKNFFLFPL